MMISGVYYLLPLLLLQSGSISCVDVSDLSMNVLKRLLSVDPKELILNPTQKQLLNEKLKQIQGINTISCEYFDMDKNQTHILGRKEYCMEKLGLNELNSADFANVVCENENETWNKIMDCILPSIQIFTMSAVKCNLGEYNMLVYIMNITGISDIVQHMIVQTFPTLMNSFVDFVCDNLGVLLSEIPLNEEKDYLGSQGFALCLFVKNQGSVFLGEMSFCRKLANADARRAVYECLGETDLNDVDDPKMKEMFRYLRKLIKIEPLEEYKEPILLKIIWEEVCSEESPLSKLFNDDASYEFDHSSNNKEKLTEDGPSVVNLNAGASVKTEL